MTAIQQVSLALTAIWFALIMLRFRRSTVALVAGLVVVGGYTIVSLIAGKVSLTELGLDASRSWLATLKFAVIGLAVMLVYSPLADRVASHWFEKPPTLDSFRAIQGSMINLVIGILIAWLLGGFLEELIARGIILRSVEAFLKPWVVAQVATTLAILIAALGAGLMHSYQGPRAVLIIAQLSILFGILFVIRGYNLWTVILCHGLYDTIAFIRFANKTSRYAQ